MRSLHGLRNWIRKRRHQIFPFALGALAIFIPVIYLVLKNPPEVKAAPWSTTHGTYGKRKQVTLTNNSGATLHSTTTYKVTIDTKSLVDSGALQSDCDDLQVVYQPNDTTALELKRNLEYASGATCATSTATQVVFPLQADISNAANSAYYYLYYGNPDATAYSSADALAAYNVGTKTATFVAPFNGTTTALAAGSGTPTTETGAIRYSGAKSALSFDGNSDSINLGSNSSLDNLPNGNFTIESWIKLNITNSTQSTYNYLFGANTSDNNKRFYVIWHNDTKKPSIMIDCGTTDGSVASNVAFTPNEWLHFAITYSSGLAKIFINGTEVTYSGTPSSCTGDYFDDSSNNKGVSYGNWGGSNLNALLDEFRISNTVRYTANFTPQTTPFIRDEYTKLLLHFDENGDDPRNTGKAIDDSGNGNHGTITGAKYVSGLVGVDNSSTTTGYQSSQSYAGHGGVFVEEGTTNKITNPSFEHATYDTNWTPVGGDWWEAGGATGIVAAYQPKGAASYDASLENLANPGTYDLTEGSAPSWSTSTGWTFTTGNRLLTGYAPSNSATFIVRYVPANNGNSKRIFTTDSAYCRTSLSRSWTWKIEYKVGNSSEGALSVNDGTTYVVALAGVNGYIDGESDDTVSLGCYGGAILILVDMMMLM